MDAFRSVWDILCALVMLHALSAGRLLNVPQAPRYDVKFLLRGASEELQRIAGGSLNKIADFLGVVRRRGGTIASHTRARPKRRLRAARPARGLLVARWETNISCGICRLVPRNLLKIVLIANISTNDQACFANCGWPPEGSRFYRKLQKHT